jgi:hypothetical protein
MPIVEGDPVVGMILCKSYAYSGDSVDGYVSQGAVWQTVSLPFTGTYDDYGFVDNIDPRFAGVSMKGACGVPFDKIVTAAKNGDGVDADMPHPFGKSSLKAMFVHQDVWERLSSKTRSNLGRDILIGDEVARIGEFIEIEVRQTEDRISRSKFPAETPFFFNNLGGSVEHWTEATGRHWKDVPYISDFFVSRKNEGLHSTLVRSVTKRVEELWAAGEKTAIDALLTDCLRITIFDENMGYLRRLWTPQCGLGSQGTDYDLHAEMAAMVSERCSRLSMDDDYDSNDEAPTGPSPL